MIVTTGRPIISVAAYPNIRSAAGLQNVTSPSSVVLMIASSDDWTIAASSVEGVVATSVLIGS